MDPKPKHIFTDEEIESLKELGDVLRDIHNRLISEGWVIKGGVFISPDGISYTKENADQYFKDQKKKLKDRVQSTRRAKNG